MKFHSWFCDEIIKKQTNTSIEPQPENKSVGSKLRLYVTFVMFFVTLVVLLQPDIHTVLTAEAYKYIGA